MKRNVWTTKHVALVIAMTGAIAACAFAGDWTAFRGSQHTGLTLETRVPLTWSAEKNIKWRTPLPGPGDSSPVVIGDRVILTCATDEGRVRGTYCYARNDGRELWSKIVQYEAQDPTHGTNPYCGSSPACSQDRVVVWHGSAGVHCYDLNGKVLWTRDLGVFRHIWGYGSSPIIYGDTVLLNCGPGPRQFVTALDLASGQTLWQVDEPGGETGEEGVDGNKPLWTGSWSTPVIAHVDGQDQVIVPLAKHVQAYDPRTGKIIWSIDGLGPLVYTDALVGDGLGVAMSGYHGAAIGFRLGGSGDMTEKNRLWRNESRNPQRIGSGVMIDGHVYIANEIGLAQCLDARTGAEVWKDRIPVGKLWSSIIAAEGRLYVTSQSGTTCVFAADPKKFEVLAQNSVGENTNSTLSFSDGQAFLRTFKHLLCIEEAGN